MKAVAICGSPRMGGGTERLLKTTLERLKKKGIPGDLITLGLKRIFPCSRCGTCRAVRNGSCALEGDDFPVLFKAMREADIVLIGMPGERGAAVPELKPLLERAGRVSGSAGNLLFRKIGGPLVVSHQAASTHATARLLTWFLAQEMVLCGASSGRGATGPDAVAVRADEEGEAVVIRFADSLAWLAEQLAAGSNVRLNEDR